jgi:pimeloyl-ACP methyl ester carboxylesterase
VSPLTFSAPRTDVRAQLAAPRRELLLDLGEDSDTLLLLFGSLGRSDEPAPFEFLATTGALPSSRRAYPPVPVKRVFVRDLERSWYRTGVRGLGDSIESVAEGLIDLARRLDAERVACVGASAGGYAALLFGSLIGADAVHAISPQTFLSPELRERHGDARWQQYLERLGPSPFLDLAELYRTYPGRTQAVVHYATCEPRDVAHAHELPGVELRAYEMAEPERHVVGGHALCQDLRDDGTMSALLLEAAGLAPAPAPGTRFRTGPVAGLDHSVVF